MEHTTLINITDKKKTKKQLFQWKSIKFEMQRRKFWERQFTVFPCKLYFFSLPKTVFYRTIVWNVYYSFLPLKSWSFLQCGCTFKTAFFFILFLHLSIDNFILAYRHSLYMHYCTLLFLLNKAWIGSMSHILNLKNLHAYYKNVGCLLVLIKHIFCMSIFYIPNPTQHLNLTTAF